MSSYVTEIIEAIAEEFPDNDSVLNAFYAQLVLTVGSSVNNRDVHEAWACWTAGPRGRTDHQSLIPFEDLSPEVQALDDPYTRGLSRVAAKFGY